MKKNPGHALSLLTWNTALVRICLLLSHPGALPLARLPRSVPIPQGFGCTIQEYPRVVPFTPTPEQGSLIPGEDLVIEKVPYSMITGKSIQM